MSEHVDSFLTARGLSLDIIKQYKAEYIETFDLDSYNNIPCFKADGLLYYPHFKPNGTAVTYPATDYEVYKLPDGSQGTRQCDALAEYGTGRMFNSAGAISGKFKAMAPTGGGAHVYWPIKNNATPVCAQLDRPPGITFIVTEAINDAILINELGATITCANGNTSGTTIFVNCQAVALNGHGHILRKDFLSYVKEGDTALIAFDCVDPENPQVEASYYTKAQTLFNLGLRVGRLQWPVANKGIGDHLAVARSWADVSVTYYDRKHSEAITDSFLNAYALLDKAVGKNDCWLRLCDGAALNDGDLANSHGAIRDPMKPSVAFKLSAELRLSSKLLRNLKILPAWDRAFGLYTTPSGTYFNSIRPEVIEPDYLTTPEAFLNAANYLFEPLLDFSGNGLNTLVHARMKDYENTIVVTGYEVAPLGLVPGSKQIDKTLALKQYLELSYVDQMNYWGIEQHYSFWHLRMTCLNPEIKLLSMPEFMGASGAGKSAWAVVFRGLLGINYIMDMTVSALADNGYFNLMAEMGLIMFEEFAYSKGADAERFKDFVTKFWRTGRGLFVNSKGNARLLANSIGMSNHLRSIFYNIMNGKRERRVCSINLFGKHNIPVQHLTDWVGITSDQFTENDVDPTNYHIKMQALGRVKGWLLRNIPQDYFPSWCDGPLTKIHQQFMAETNNPTQDVMTVLDVTYIEFFCLAKEVELQEHLELSGLSGPFKDIDLRSISGQSLTVELKKTGLYQDVAHRITVGPTEYKVRVRNDSQWANITTWALANDISVVNDMAKILYKESLLAAMLLYWTKRATV